MRTKKKVIAAVILGAAMWAVPAAAEAVSVTREGVKTAEYSSWKGVRVYDTKADGNSVYTEYARDSGSTGRLNNTAGNNTSAETGVSSNLISRFNACNNLSYRPDPCTSNVYR